MQERQARSVTVDVCPQCSGLWIDWFDGELATVAAHTGPLPAGRARNSDEPGSCPKCRVDLTESSYQEGGPVVLRCGECAGAFIARDALDLLIAVGPPEDLEPTRPTAWSQLVARLRGWLGA